MKRKSPKQMLLEQKAARKQRKKELEAEYAQMVEDGKKGGLFPYLPPDKESWISKRLEEWEKEQPLIISGKYKDEEQIISIYQQKFVDYIRELYPRVIEELREFVPFFNGVFGEQKHKYIDIFDRFKSEFFNLDHSLDSRINYSNIKESFLTFRPNKNQNWRWDHNWGEYSLLLHFLYYLFVPEESADKTSKIIQDASQLLQDNLVVERRMLNLPDNYDESILQNYITKQSYGIISELLKNEEHKSFWKSAKTDAIKFLEGLSPTPEASLSDFIKLQINLLEWAKRHNLEKDWLLRYACHFIKQFSDNPNLKVEDVEIPALDTFTLVAYPFEFRFDGWIPGKESREDYQKRLNDCFEIESENYFQDVGRDLKLNEIKRSTDTRNYDRVKWLVRWTVQKWSVEKIVELDFRILDALPTQEEFNRKVRYISEQLPTFKVYNLPYRNL